MYLSRFFLLLIAGSMLVSGCRSEKKPVLTGEDPVEIGDFISFFPEYKQGYQAGDTLLDKKISDSLLIGYKVFRQFVPDSLSVKWLGKNAKPRIYALGKVPGEQGASYLLVRVTTSARKQVLLLAFNKQQQFIAGMPALIPDNRRETTQAFNFDRKQTLTRFVNRKNADGSQSEGKEVYILNEESGAFMLILTEALEDKITELINPIDTLSRKQKFTADYGSGKMNLVSVRDGRKADRIMFFIHIDKNNGACSGELKGEARWTSPGKAVYTAAGDPCVLTFTFSSGSVTLNEENCGARHGIDCSFKGTYPRKKAPKQTSSQLRKKNGK